MMKKWLVLFFATLLLTSCSKQELATETSSAGFAFRVNPQTQTVDLSSIQSKGLATQAVRELVADTDLALASYSFAFMPGNKLSIEASFTNITSDLEFAQPFSFSPNGSDFVSSTEPTVSDTDLGGDGVLSPGETTLVLNFMVTHSGEAFTYLVTASADVSKIDEPPPTGNEAPIVNITNPANGDMVSSNVLVQGTATDDVAVTMLSYTLNSGTSVEILANLVGNNFSFSISSEDLVEGDNTITVTAEDGEGEIGSDTVAVMFDSERPPPAGNDVVVVNDINVFDQFAMNDANNVTLVQNLVNFPATGGSRDSGTVVVFDRGRNARCRGNNECSDTNMATMRSTITAAGYTLSDVDSSSGSITSIPSNVRVIFLWTPLVAFTPAEINVFKQFAAEGGRLVFIGEHSGYYGAGIPIENQFLLDIGAVMTNTGGAYDCGRQITSNVDPNQVTDGMTQVSFGCASELLLGPNDFSLWRGINANSSRVYAGVATIDVNPIPEVARVIEADRLEVDNNATSLGE